jgi:uncharacterized protein (DUF1778 family)
MKPSRPGKIENSDVIISARFTPDEASVIRHLAEYNRLTVSELIRRAVLEHHSLAERHTRPRSATIDAA